MDRPLERLATRMRDHPFAVDAALAGLLASVLPARRAARISPVAAIAG
jgi:ABC-type lipoprotein release transport system permease subunit